MGIPSYFAHVIRSFTHILSKQSAMTSKGVIMSRLYLDCNSILYDSYHALPQTMSYEEMKNEIIDNTIKKIEEYRTLFLPSELMFIAFDGVAPLAKMEQQRNRRYKSWFESNVTQRITNATVQHSSSMFTPGTDFMNELSRRLYRHFKGNPQVIVQASDVCGEGEHKLYQHLRENPPSINENVAIYGLDADLLMLSLVHLTHCNIYVSRESPHFASVLLSETKGDVKDNELICINIQELAHGVLQDMNCNPNDMHRVHDYVFLCFLLGNDFLPHFPSLNIRTKGIDTIIEIYNRVVSSKDRYLIDKNKNIDKKVFRLVLLELAKDEHSNLCKEYGLRRKWDRNTPEMQPKTTEKEKLQFLQNIPVMYRHEEKYIFPYEKTGWKERYYRSLFEADVCVDKICQNYLEGIDWVTNYYMRGTVQWRWKYDYHYPPLFSDLIKYFNTYTSLNEVVDNIPVNVHTQLAYVLPPPQHMLLPERVQNKLMTLYSHVHVYSIEDLTFAWAFCRYFWECHVVLPDISLDTIRTWDKIFM